MIVVIVTACSILHGARCQERYLAFEDTGQTRTPYGCMIGGMFAVSEWQTHNPNWRVHAWRCARAGVGLRA